MDDWNVAECDAVCAKEPVADQKRDEPGRLRTEFWFWLRKVLFHTIGIGMVVLGIVGSINGWPDLVITGPMCLWLGVSTILIGLTLERHPRHYWYYDPEDPFSIAAELRENQAGSDRDGSQETNA